MDAREVKNALLSRHHAASGATNGGMPGAWTCIEEWRGIDLLAFAAWSSFGYRRVGYEVKVSRADLRRELLAPYKRASNVEWCHEFYFAVPRGLLLEEEIAWVEPEWEAADWRGERCPGLGGVACLPWSRRSTFRVRVPIPTTSHYSERWTNVVCPTCEGRGETTRSRVVREAPQCWVPRDVGLVVVDGRGTKLIKKSPRRKDVPVLGDAVIGQMVRWISMRPDPRHHPTRA